MGAHAKIPPALHSFTEAAGDAGGAAGERPSSSPFQVQTSSQQGWTASLGSAQLRASQSMSALHSSRRLELSSNRETEGGVGGHAGHAHAVSYAVAFPRRRVLLCNGRRPALPLPAQSFRRRGPLLGAGCSILRIHSALHDDSHASFLVWWSLSPPTICGGGAGQARVS